MESEDTTTGILRRKVRPRIAIGDDNPGEIWRSKHVCAGKLGFYRGDFPTVSGHDLYRYLHGRYLLAECYVWNLTCTGVP